ncbi:CpaF family protein [Candidatus Woesearchaeota archaeon]|nr:CpaF family protein [Candidatus Woesearchaeota archaeon]
MEGNIIPLDSYKIAMEHELVDIDIYKDEKGFSHYDISIKNISRHTNIILRKIREEFISEIAIGTVEIGSQAESEAIKEKFKEEILILIQKYFPNADKRTTDLLISELIRQNIGLGDIEILLKDEHLEEIVVNSAAEPVQVYHKKHGWLSTNIRIPNETKIRHYATMIGRDVGKEITLLKPLMDAHLLTGDRVNATLNPISSTGNTITIRKFSSKPWTITDFLQKETINYEAAALIWLAVEYEISIIISGGTGSGKTSMLNVISSFIPINQRVISIEDTREITLPKEIHWVPLETRLPNPEGQGEITMLDLVVNSLRMRPDRIIMGEVRRKKEAEVLFEAMHTGHSVYATLHANNVRETVERLTNPPIEVPKQMLGSIGLIVVQNRNRRTGHRFTTEVAQMLPGGNPEIVMRLNPSTGKMETIKEPTEIYKIISAYTGMTNEHVVRELDRRVKLLKWLVENNINDVHQVGSFFRKHYTGSTA